MNYLTIKISQNLIYKMIVESAVKNSVDHEILDLIKNNPEILSIVFQKDKKSKKQDLLTLAFQNKNTILLNELVLLNEAQEKLTDAFKNLEINSKNKLVNLINHKIIYYLIDIHYNNNTFIDNNELFNLKNVLSNVLLTNNDYNVQLNAMVSDHGNPLFFNLLNYFKNNTNLLLKTNTIEWSNKDEIGNTAFHYLFKYNSNIQKVLLEKMKELNGWEFNNNNNETPLIYWIRNIEKKTAPSILWKILEMPIKWESNEKQLLEFLKKTMNCHHFSGNTVDESNVYKDIFIKISEIPEFKSNKVQGYLNGLFIHSKLSNDNNYNEKAMFMKTIFTTMKLDKELPQKNEITKKMKI